MTAATCPLPLIAADEEAEHELDVKYRRQLEAAKTSRGMSDDDSMDVRSAGSGDEARQGAAGEQGQGWQEECGRRRQARIVKEGRSGATGVERTWVREALETFSRA